MSRDLKGARSEACRSLKVLPGRANIKLQSHELGEPGLLTDQQIMCLEQEMLWEVGHPLGLETTSIGERERPSVAV
jgi:hypothetical protein